jgi:phosphoglycerate dehydrogenase-like enzyme
VAELAFALIFACAKRIPSADQAVRNGDFAFRYRRTSFELQGKVLGLVGFGRVARRMAVLGRAFGMEVVVWSRHASADEVDREGGRPLPTLDELCANADILSLHALPQAAPLLDGPMLARLKPGAIVVNTARGALVDEAALAAALHSGRLAGAGLDVFTAEPLDMWSPLFDAPNLVLTPHIGGSTWESLERTACAVAQDVIRVLRDEPPLNPVTGASLAHEMGKPPRRVADP